MCSGFALTAFCYKHGATVQIRSKPEIDRHLSEVRFPALWAGAWANGCTNGRTGALNGCMFFASISDWCVCAFVEQWLVRGNIILLAVRQSCENHFNSVHVWHACNIFVCVSFLVFSCLFCFTIFFFRREQTLNWLQLHPMQSSFGETIAVFGGKFCWVLGVHQRRY